MRLNLTRLLIVSYVQSTARTVPLEVCPVLPARDNSGHTSWLLLCEHYGRTFKKNGMWAVAHILNRVSLAVPQARSSGYRSPRSSLTHAGRAHCGSSLCFLPYGNSLSSSFLLLSPG